MADKYFELDNKENSKHKDINMGEILINFMEQDSDNKIDSQTLLGIDNTRNKKLKELLNRSDFVTLRSKASRSLCIQGETAFAILIHNNKEYIRNFEIENYKMKFNEFIEITVHSNYMENKKNAEEKEFYRWYFNDEGRVVREGYTINTTTKEKKISSEFVYPTKYKTIPVGRIRNNPISEPDYFKAMTIFKEISTLSNDIGTEWEMTKTIWQNSTWAGNGDGEDFVDKLKQGSNVVTQFNPNSKAAQQFGVIMQGSLTVSQLIQSIVFLEDRAMKYSFSGRDMDNSGTNKHNAQVGLFNQAHSEYLQKKARQRERDYYNFFNDIVTKYIPGIKLPAKITFDMSEFEKGKVEGMSAAQANRELLQTQSRVNKKAAEKSQATAEKEAALAAKAEAEAKVIEEARATTVSKSEENSTRKNEKA